MIHAILVLHSFLDSGHGTQLPDDNGESEDGLDECMMMIFVSSLINLTVCDRYCDFRH